MEHYDIIFCVLTYKNATDLREFISSVGKEITCKYKIIVVNNYADEQSLLNIKDIVYEHKSYVELIESENDGYSKGNNLGINYIKKKYSFEYLIISNPDIEILKLNYSDLIGNNDKIIAPNIITNNGKQQNPFYYKYMPLSELLVYYGFLKKNRFIASSGIAMNKFSRKINKLIYQLKRKKSIYACHGSFIIFGNKAINNLIPVFDENFFLFCEENVLAQKAKDNKVELIYMPKIEILHKEDGSMGLSNMNINKLLRDSYIYYYENYILK